MSSEIEKARDDLAMIERERQRRNFTEFHLARTERFNQEIQLLREENKRLRADLAQARQTIEDVCCGAKE